VAVASSDGSMTAPALRFGADSTDTGGVNASCDFINGSTGNQWGISVSDSLTFVPTTHDIYFEVDNVSGSPLLALAPVAAVHSSFSQRVDPLHPTLLLRRNR